MPRRTSLWFLDGKNIGFREDDAAITCEDELLVETLYSGVSHGTERLIYRGEVAEGLQLDAAVRKLLRVSALLLLIYSFTSDIWSLHRRAACASPAINSTT